MIELAASVVPPPKTGALAPVGGVGTGDFSLVLAGLPGAGTEIPVLPGTAGKRQAVAGNGKALPGETKDEDLSKDLIWLPAGLLAPVPLPATVKLTVLAGRLAAGPVGGPVAPRSLDIPTIVSPPLAVSLSPADAGGQFGEAVARSPASPDRTPAAAGKPTILEAAPVKTEIVARGLETAKAELPVRVDAASVAPQSQQTQPQPPLLQPAGQAFASAIAVAVQAQSHRERETDARAPLAIASAALDAISPPAIAATAEAKQGALDLRQDTGLQGMIDHIEVLRDGADANDTRIRLVPDALGAVDVSVRKDGERVHVHFTTENQTSARLIAEAQPQLAELAEARGVRLGDATVGTGVDSGGGNTRQPMPAQPTSSAAPASALIAAADPITDTRIA